MRTIDRLKQSSSDELKDLFKGLGAPLIEEMHGEYRGYFFGSDSHLFSNLIWHLGANLDLLSGVWQGKSFAPLSHDEGWGVNTLKKSGMTIRRWPMRTSLTRSSFDSGYVFKLDYRYYYSTAGKMQMHDEIRKVNENTFLGVCHWRLPVGIPLAPIWFALYGPVGPFDTTGGRL